MPKAPLHEVRIGTSGWHYPLSGYKVRAVTATAVTRYWAAALRICAAPNVAVHLRRRTAELIENRL